MKRIALIALLIFTLPLNSCAQWYLFPGKNKKAKPEKAEPVVVEETKPDTTSAKPSLIEIDKFFFDPTIDLTLIMPLKSESEKPSDNFLDMYAGALMAVRELGENSYKVRLRVEDMDAADYLHNGALTESDVIIGPITDVQIQEALPYLNAGQVIVSPLNPKVAALSEQAAVVQSPTPWESQIDELVDWVDEDLKSSEELILIRDSTANGQGAKCDYIVQALARKGLTYRTVRRMGELEMTKEQHYRVMLASESDAFVVGAARSVAIEAARKTAGSVVLYCSSRVRGSIGANVSDLHDAYTHLTAAYHIDYNSPKVRDFILAYRALFNSEPNSFAFQAYDLVSYYVRACAQYGRNWAKRLPDFNQHGLQSDFRFDEQKASGRINTAARRVLYNTDLTTELVN